MGKHGEALREISRNQYKAIMAAKESGVDLDEYIEGVSKTSMEIGKTKPYAECYGGLYLTKKYEESVKHLRPIIV